MYNPKEPLTLPRLHPFLNMNERFLFEVHTFGMDGCKKGHGKTEKPYGVCYYRCNTKDFGFYSSCKCVSCSLKKGKSDEEICS